MSTEHAVGSAAWRHVLDRMEHGKWASAVAAEEPMFLKLVALEWTTQQVMVELRTKCPRCAVKFTLSCPASTEVAYSYHMREYLRQLWADMLTQHVCLAK